jgi:hypothetical protein
MNIDEDVIMLCIFESGPPAVCFRSGGTEGAHKTQARDLTHRTLRISSGPGACWVGLVGALDTATTARGFAGGVCQFPIWDLKLRGQLLSPYVVIAWRKAFIHSSLICSCTCCEGPHVRPSSSSRP